MNGIAGACGHRDFVARAWRQRHVARTADFVEDAVAVEEHRRGRSDAERLGPEPYRIRHCDRAAFADPGEAGAWRRRHHRDARRPLTPVSTIAMSPIAKSTNPSRSGAGR